jgi:hypothetical protein
MFSSKSSRRKCAIRNDPLIEMASMLIRVPCQRRKDIIRIHNKYTTEHTSKTYHNDGPFAMEMLCLHRFVKTNTHESLGHNLLNFSSIEAGKLSNECLVCGIIGIHSKRN